MAVGRTEATPEAFVRTVTLRKLALAPDPGGEKVTGQPETGTAFASVTRTESGAANAVETAADCEPPPFAASWDGPSVARPVSEIQASRNGGCPVAVFSRLSNPNWAPGVVAERLSCKPKFVAMCSL